MVWCGWWERKDLVIGSGTWGNKKCRVIFSVFNFMSELCNPNWNWSERVVGNIFYWIRRKAWFKRNSQKFYKNNKICIMRLLIFELFPFVQIHVHTIQSRLIYAHYYINRMKWNLVGKTIFVTRTTKTIIWRQFIGLRT